MERSIIVIVFTLMLLIYSFSVVSATSLVDDQKQSPSSVTWLISDQDNNSASVSKMYSSLKKAFDSNKEQLRSMIKNGTGIAPVPISKQSEKGMALNFYSVHIASEWQLAISRNSYLRKY